MTLSCRSELRHGDLLAGKDGAVVALLDDELTVSYIAQDEQMVVVDGDAQARADGQGALLGGAFLRACGIAADVLEFRPARLVEVAGDDVEGGGAGRALVVDEAKQALHGVHTDVRFGLALNVERKILSVRGVT